MAFGYHARILHVDLGSGVCTIEAPDEAFYRLYMGGSAFGAYYLFKNSPPGCDPLGPDNLLVLSLSVLTGAPISGLSRMTATARSPLTETIGDSQCGGFWPARCKFAGFDSIVIGGRSAKPVYLWLHDGQATIRDAAHLWGRITGEVEKALKAEHGEEVEVLQCGPAGEKLVRYAAIINMRSRANGRTGMGAVMGSKKLKAVVVQGSQKPEVADKESLKRLAKWGVDHFEKSDLYATGTLGTASAISGQQLAGGFPTRNWASGVFDGWASLDGQRMADTILVNRDTCYGCIVRCKRVVEKKDGPYPLDPYYGGPEYETIGTFGSYCGIDDLVAVAFASQLCNQYGVDTISCGATIAWAMDCFERGIITLRETGGIPLKFGNAEAMVKVTEQICRREGLGEILGEGSSRAAKHFGKGAGELVLAVKNLEYAAHMPQVKRSCALIYAVNPFGADHQSHEHDPAYGAYPKKMAQFGLLNPQPDTAMNGEKVRFALYMQHVYSITDTLNLCQFVWGPAWQLYDCNQMVEMVRAVSGWDVNLFELMKAGERRLNMLRAYNAREGIGREADTLPPKMSVPLKGGPSDGLFVPTEEFEQAKNTYYGMAGWDPQTGYPTRAKLEELGIGWMADALSL
jgi:aldehyde:ferredoxin oxidoreductase